MEYDIDTNISYEQTYDIDLLLKNIGIVINSESTVFMIFIQISIK